MKLTLLLCQILFISINAEITPSDNRWGGQQAQRMCVCHGNCPKLSCCVSGFITMDGCGCCPVCAKGRNEECGEAYQIKGICAPGLWCHTKAWEHTGKCKQVTSWKEKGDPNREADVKRMQEIPVCATYDCESCELKSCPKLNCCSTGFTVKDKCHCCDECAKGRGETCGVTFNYFGKCAPNLKCRNLCRPNIEDCPSTCVEAKDAATEIEKCKAPPPATIACKCDDANMRLLCAKHKHCFLKNITNAKHPQENCYEDVEFSSEHGRFYSRKACRAQPFYDEDFSAPAFNYNSIDPSSSQQAGHLPLQVI